MKVNINVLLAEFYIVFPWVDPAPSDQYWFQRFQNQFSWLGENPRDFISDHANWLELRVNLTLLMPLSLLYYVPFVLCDLALTHTNDIVDTEGAEFVLMYLGDSRDYPESHYQKLANEEGMRVAQEQRMEDVFLRKMDNNRFSKFNEEQSATIYNWLEFASDWKDFEFYRDELELALLYWKNPRALPHERPSFEASSLQSKVSLTDVQALHELKELMSVFPWVNPNVGDAEWFKEYGPRFPRAARGRRDYINDHDYWLRVRAQPPLSVLYYVPFMICDLTLVHINDPSSSQGAEFMIRYLKPDQEYLEAEYQDVVVERGEKSASQIWEANVSRRKLHQNDFIAFNKEQSLAIYHWLKALGDWRDFDNCKEALDLAVRYWKERSS